MRCTTLTDFVPYLLRALAYILSIVGGIHHRAHHRLLSRDLSRFYVIGGILMF